MTNVIPFCPPMGWFQQSFLHELQLVHVVHSLINPLCGGTSSSPSIISPLGTLLQRIFLLLQLVLEEGLTSVLELH